MQILILKLKLIYRILLNKSFYDLLDVYDEKTHSIHNLNNVYLNNINSNVPPGFIRNDGPLPGIMMVSGSITGLTTLNSLNEYYRYSDYSYTITDRENNVINNYTKVTEKKKVEKKDLQPIQFINI